MCTSVCERASEQSQGFWLHYLFVCDCQSDYGSHAVLTEVPLAPASCSPLASGCWLGLGVT